MFDRRIANGRFCSIDEVSETLVENLCNIKLEEEPPVKRSDAPKTRFLGFAGTSKSKRDGQFGELATVDNPEDLTPLGRLVIVGGPGRGKSFPITDSFTRIGRGEDQEIQLDFGDEAISRDGHATIVHYGARNGFVIRDGMKVNPVQLNDRTIKGDAPLCGGDIIQMGETSMLFMTFSQQT